MANLSKADAKRGLYDKYTVIRNDGADQPGERHDGCAYFVLDLTHDLLARKALQAYARAAANSQDMVEFRRNFASELNALIERLPPLPECAQCHGPANTPVADPSSGVVLCSDRCLARWQWLQSRYARVDQLAEEHLPPDAFGPDR